MDIDGFILKHLHYSAVKNGKRLEYTAQELHELCKITVTSLRKQPMLVKMNPPCVIVGDLQGQYCDLLRVFSMYSEGEVSGALAQKYVFLGNYIGRGGQSLETLCIILALMIRFPSKYLVLRGNQEVFPLSRNCGFLEEIVERFGSSEGQKILESFDKVFSWMPIAALLSQKILCVHGGISPNLKKLSDIESLRRPLEQPEWDSLAHDLLWAEPKAGQVGFTPSILKNARASVFFGEDEVHRTCKEFNLDLIVRSHQHIKSGFETFADNKLLSIFSAPRFNNTSNAAASLRIDDGGRLGIDVLRPAECAQEIQFSEEHTEESARTVDTNSEMN